MAYTEEQTMIRDLVRDFAAGELAARAARIDAEARFPEDLLSQLAAVNLLGLAVTAEAGGAGVDAVSYALALEELARVCGSTALLVAAHNTLAAWPLEKWGTPAQRSAWLGPMARGEWLGACAVSESEAGSDVAAIRTTAKRRGENWILHGEKHWIVNAAQARLFLVLAQIEPRDTGTATALFAVERDRRGLDVRPAGVPLGLRGTGLGSLGLHDVEIPAGHLVGDAGRGLAHWDEIQDRASIALGAIAVGIGQGAFERALRYARERPQFDRPIADFQSVQWRIVDAGIEMQAARLMVHDAGRKLDAGEPIAKAAAMAKVFATEAATRAADHALQVHGGYGYITEYPVERTYREAKVCEVAWGTNEIQRLRAMRALLQEADAGLALLQ
jgi:butyryl-CoA dehydrogenase